MNQPLRVLIVDDSALFRQVLSDTISEMAIARLSGFAKDGKEAIEKIALLQPDVVTLDVEMPVMNGIEALEIISSRWPQIKVVMVTSLNKHSIQHTIAALEASAFSFITKPAMGGNEIIAKELNDALLAIYHSKYTSNETIQVRPSLQRKTVKASTPKVIAIGISTGGPKALSSIIHQFPKNLSVPVLIVQHIPSNFSGPLAESLNTKANVPVKEAINGEILKPGTVYIAPGGLQMKIAEKGLKVVQITDDPPEQFCKPSVDYLLRSLASVFPGEVICAIMTGMGSDGTKGLQLLKRHGAIAIGQNKETSTVYGMPASALAAGVIDKEVNLEDVIPTLLSYL